MQSFDSTARLGSITDQRLTSGVHPDYLAESQRLGQAAMQKATGQFREAVATDTQAAARALDDDHVGTEHLTLALFGSGPNRARTALEEVGISQEIYTAALDNEAGPSPAGFIPMTPRAVMIVGLSVTEAERLAAEELGLEHLLLGVIRESERWERQHAWGPHHLRKAAESVGSSPRDIEERLMRLLPVSKCIATHSAHDPVATTTRKRKRASS